MEFSVFDDLDELDRSVESYKSFEDLEGLEFFESYEDYKVHSSAKMNEFERALLSFNVRTNELNDFMSIQSKLMVDSLYDFASFIVQEFNEARESDKEKNPNFRYWKYFCFVEKGKTAVIIRWREFLGKSKFSDPVGLSEMKDFRMPAKVFVKCSKPEKKAILLAEDKFCKVRKINNKIGLSLESVRAMKDMTTCRSDIFRVDEVLNEFNDIDCIEHYEQLGEVPSEFDRDEFRKSLGL
ncbi:hypothetical protein [Vreelandella sedimenti]|uniref:hypothetical protein n=1 Tax=Vreelandella sedimenti TaxID=2729618 RepID=UPI0025795F18|nr:hypothetical protein [Halomonas sp. UBA3173]|tara:strand:- start:19275 stop:19991 length:717 start_codon:yes stop_codon:yes gene_type:complete